MQISAANRKRGDYFFQMLTPPSGAHLDGVSALLDAALERGAFSAAVALVAEDGRIVGRHTAGVVRAWDAPGRPATPPGPPVDLDTRFDLASLTKPIVAAALLAELEQHGLDDGLPVAELLGEFREPALRTTSIRHLLTHTAGFVAEWRDRAPDPLMRRFRARSRPQEPAGAVHRYTCVGYLWAGLAAEALAGERLDAVVRRRVLGPLGMRSTGFLPARELLPHIAATEHQPGRGLVHGEVHDETASALGGVCGNAGLFGTGPDVLRFAEAVRTGGLLDGARVLSAAVADRLVTPVELPTDPGYGQAAGLRLDERWTRAWVGSSAAPGARARATTAGHTGFTGTAFATEPGGRRSLVLLTNRVHPARTSTELLALRADVVRQSWRAKSSG